MPKGLAHSALSQQQQQPLQQQCLPYVTHTLCLSLLLSLSLGLFLTGLAAWVVDFVRGSCAVLRSIAVNLSMVLLIPYNVRISLIELKAQCNYSCVSVCASV